MNSDTLIYTILGMIVCLAIGLPFLIARAIEKGREMKPPSLPTIKHKK